MSSLTPDTARDLQNEAPATNLALDEVGVRDLSRGAIVGTSPATLAIDVGVSLSAQLRGVHMSRFHESVDEALGSPPRTDSLAQLAWDIAREARERQAARRSRARVRATLVDPHPTPASGRISHDPYDAIADVVLDGDAAPTFATTATVTGITACPCAQELLTAAARERLQAQGRSAGDVEEILACLPMATHNQRGESLLQVRSGVPVDPAVLAGLARGCMSARVHELLKREDEGAVVAQAHEHPRFVEDCVRDLLRAVVECGLDLRDDDVITARQTNFESIHAHDAVAARTATVGELRAELEHARG